MIASWMGYWLAASVVIGVASLAAEWTRRMARRPLRWVWTVSILVCLLAPFLARGIQRAWGTITAPSAGVTATTVQRLAPPSSRIERSVAIAADEPPRAAWDVLLLVAWVLASAVFVARLLLAIRRLHGLRDTWRQVVIDGQSVLVSSDVGPAVAGFTHQHVVLPEWALAASAGEQRLMLLHEREHMRSRDPYVLLAALVAAALMPWNVVLWWLVRRLRLAVELDCDARVLQQIPDIQAYGALLIEVGRRGSSRRVVPLAALSDPPTFLERRISMLSTQHPRNAVLTAIAVVGLSAIPAGAATMVPQPAAVRPVLVAPWRSRAAGADSIAPEALRAMKISLRKLMTAQEAHFSDHGAYAGDVTKLAGFVTEAGVGVQLTWANGNAYVAAAKDADSPGATCIVHVGFVPRSAWPTTALESKTGSDGMIVCDGDGSAAQARWDEHVRNFMAFQLGALILPQERARGALGTYPSDSAQIPGNRFDPALHFWYLWADTASWAAKAVYDSLPGKSCVIWEGSHPRRFVRTDAQRRFAARGEATCDDF